VSLVGVAAESSLQIADVLSFLLGDPYFSLKDK